MKKIVLAMALMAVTSWGAKVEYTEAKSVDTSQESPEAIAVKSVEALARNDKEAYLSMCSDAYIQELNELNGAPLEAKLRSAQAYDLAEQFLYANSKIDEINKVWYFRIKVHHRKFGKTANRGCKVALIDGKYKLIDD